jgi:hypothetical protein
MYYINLVHTEDTLSKYDALGEFLKRQPRDAVPMTFGQIERITGTKLPASSRYRAWWSNNDFNSVLTQVWIEAGFKSEQVDMEKRKLVFRRMRKPNVPAEALAAGEKPFHPLYGYMEGLIRIMPGVDITQPADPEWADRLDAEYGPEKREK